MDFVAQIDLRRRAALALGTSALLALPLALGAAGNPSAWSPQDEAIVPGPRPVDAFHPATKAGEAAPGAVYGGRAIVHLESMPEGINRAVENSAVTRAMHHLLHESLVRQDWEDWTYEPNLSNSWAIEDMLVLTEEAADRFSAYPLADGAIDLTTEVQVKIPSKELDPLRDAAIAAGQEADDVPTRRAARVLFGTVESVDGGFSITPTSKGNVLAEVGPLTVPAADVRQVERGSVFTFDLLDDAVWHPVAGFEDHGFDAQDAVFSWSIYSNPDVKCDDVRFQFVKVTRGDVVDEHTARFFYESQYFAALGSIGVDMMILPSHLYNLADPDNPKYVAATAPGGTNYDPELFLKRQAEWVNDNPHNRDQFVGLGPYRVTTYDQQYIEVSRFEDYFDPERAGYLDVVRYRNISSDDTAWQALINGELDFFYRVKSSYYFGPQTESEEFQEEFYKGYYYLGTYGFTAWNNLRAGLDDPSVRRALALAFDADTYLQTNYKGLARRVSGPFPFDSAAYDHSIAPAPYDPDLAIELLEDAGWYDRNGNGIADKGGVELELEFLMPSGNEASENLAQKMQEDFGGIGIGLSIKAMEWATFLEQMKNRDFDGGNLAWSPALESDPEQVWHSRWAKPGVPSSNMAAFQDAEVDALIEAGQIELDEEKRTAIWQQVHARINELTPYLFGYNVPRKFAMNKNLRGFKSYAIRPGYDVRDWYFAAGTEGTRPTLAR